MDCFATLIFRKLSTQYKLSVFQIREDSSQSSHLLDTKILTHDTEGYMYFLLNFALSNAVF